MSMTNPSGELISMDARIGERVHQLMWRNQVTQKAFGEVLGLGQSGLSLKLRGKRSWSPDELVTVTRVFSVTLDYLFGFSDDMGPGSVNLPPSDYMSAVSAEVIDLASRRASA